MLCNHFDMLLSPSLPNAHKIYKERKETVLHRSFFKERRVQARKSLGFLPEVKWKDLQILMFALL